MTDPYQFLISSSFRFVSYRPRSKQELTNFLQKKADKKKISSDIIETVMVRMEELGYINDRKFAEAYVTSALGSKPKGPSTIAFTLKQKGVSEEIIASVLQQTEEIQSPEMQLDLAKKALGKKGENYKKLPSLECKRKVHDFLLRRGFSSAIVHRLVDEYCEKSYNKALENSDV